MKLKTYLISLFFVLPFVVNGQKQLSLQEAIKTATDSSLAVFKAQNLYLASYWEYRTYIAEKKPSLTLNTTLLDYNRSLVERYNSTLDIDEYRQQQNIYSYADATISQPLTFSGGTLSVVTDLSRLQNYGENSYTQFTSVPVSISLSQPLFAFNEYKWLRKIEPIKYEKAKKTYLQAVETISVNMVDYFFDLLVAHAGITMNTTNVANADTLYNIGQKRLEIASLSLADVLTLKVDAYNARNDLATAKKTLKNALFSFNSYLRINESITVDLLIPENLPSFQVDYEEALKLAMQNNPDVQGYQQELLEAARDLEETKRDNSFTATVTASYGLNQQNSLLKKAYQNPLDQQEAAITLSVPIIDWGQRRGTINTAKNNYRATNLTIEQDYIDFRQEVMMAVTNFNMQLDIVNSAYETRKVAKQAYEITKQRFVIGKSDVNSLGLALTRQDEANVNYLEALRSYWKYYYTLRQLTLYDFENKKTLSQDFDKMFDLL
jgi:outer membrane protein TolC